MAETKGQLPRWRELPDLELYMDQVLSLTERCRFTKGIFAWVGFNTYYMPYKVEARATGKSNWNFFKLLKYAMDGIMAFSVKPLLIVSP